MWINCLAEGQNCRAVTGIEPGTRWSRVQRTIHYTTAPPILQSTEWHWKGPFLNCCFRSCSRHKIFYIYPKDMLLISLILSWIGMISLELDWAVSWFPIYWKVHLQTLTALSLLLDFWLLFWRGCVVQLTGMWAITDVKHAAPAM